MTEQAKPCNSSRCDGVNHWLGDQAFVCPVNAPKASDAPKRCPECKHTPGPWFQSHREKPNGRFITEVYDKEGQTICALAWHAVPTATGVTTDRDPNARLIAAAPDLLEACKAMMRHHGMMSHEGVKMCADAIAKAEGQR